MFSSMEHNNLFIPQLLHHRGRECRYIRWAEIYDDKVFIFIFLGKYVTFFYRMFTIESSHNLIEY